MVETRLVKQVRQLRESGIGRAEAERTLRDYVCSMARRQAWTEHELTVALAVRLRVLRAVYGDK